MLLFERTIIAHCVINLGQPSTLWHGRAGLAIPVSAFIITKNEELRLPRTLAALQPWVDEIVVVDSGSTDRTVELAGLMGATIFHREWSGYGGQKHFAEQQCRNEWVLNVDADEVITPDLSLEICALFADDARPKPGAFCVRILTVYPGDAKPRRFADDYNEVRFYHRSIGTYRDHPVFDRVLVKGTVPRQLQQPIFHFPYTSFAHLITKINEFSSFRSRSSDARRPSILVARLFIEFPTTFIKHYFFRLHITGGWKGFYFALCTAFMRTTRIAKMLETQFLPPAEQLPRSEPVRKSVETQVTM